MNKLDALRLGKLGEVLKEESRKIDLARRTKDVKQIMALAEDPSWRVRRELISKIFNGFIDKDVRTRLHERLAKDPSWRVRRAIAYRTSKMHPAYDILAADRNPLVRGQLAGCYRKPS